MFPNVKFSLVFFCALLSASRCLMSLTATLTCPSHFICTHTSVPSPCLGFLFFLTTETRLLSVLVKSSHAHIDTRDKTHTRQRWLRLSINNANGQQANEHVMADWKGINEHRRTISHTQNTHPHASRFSMPR